MTQINILAVQRSVKISDKAPLKLYLAPFLPEFVSIAGSTLIALPHILSVF